MAETEEIKTDEPLDREAVARRRTALAQIRQYGDPVLRMRANEVEDFDEDLARLAARMTALMEDAMGVGLAGNQAGVLRRIFVFQPEKEGETLALVNPRIVERSEETEVDDEGCLSLQGVLAPVERNLRVTVEAQDPTGAPIRLEVEALAARAVQHEIDHLDGVLLLDRTTTEARKEALAALRPRLVIG